MQNFKYLALGDSYTIGEQVLLTQSFPYQFIRKMRKQATHLKRQISFSAPEIIAKTGWTTDELLLGISSWIFDAGGYDMVSLLIGVNNQYRGRENAEYAEQFSELLQMAIEFARGINGNVYVLSIPDWGVTPFAKSRNTTEIARQIDEFNQTARRIVAERRCHFMDITTGLRLQGQKEEYLAPDGLHPSGKAYEKWAESLMSEVVSTL